MLFSDRDGREAGDGGRGHFRHVVEIENGGTFDRDRARSRGRPPRGTARRTRRRGEAEIALAYCLTGKTTTASGSLVVNTPENKRKRPKTSGRKYHNSPFFRLYCRVAPLSHLWYNSELPPPLFVPRGTFEPINTGVRRMSPPKIFSLFFVWGVAFGGSLCYNIRRQGKEAERNGNTRKPTTKPKTKTPNGGRRP